MVKLPPLAAGFAAESLEATGVPASGVPETNIWSG
jgi:hypothetical protein